MLCNNCDEIKKDDYLYHYTSLETLALILKNRTIRFNSLLNVDDLQEKEANNGSIIGQCCYVSCWTSDEKESIPMWNMYGNWTAGVRIGLPRDPFKILKNQNNPFNENLPKIESSYFSMDDMKKRGYYTDNAFYVNSMLKRVEYSDDDKDLHPEAINFNIDDLINLENNDFDDTKRYEINFSNIGVYKNKYWTFQKEYRYMFYLYPIRYLFPNLNYKKLIKDIAENKIIIPFFYLDFKISNEAFSKMKIVLSPKISAGNRIIAETLVEKYNRDAEINESKLTGKIR